VAVLIDGGFYLKRYRAIYGGAHDPRKTAKTMHTMSLSHLSGDECLYRIFYYDCEPFAKKVHNPITNKSIDFSKTPHAVFRREFHNELKKLRKVALRFGRLGSGGGWLIRPDMTKALLRKSTTIEELDESAVFYDLKQKGIDIKIGVDIASLAYKRQVQKIILISGDADFVPAAKLARREGIDFVLDPMWNNISPDLFEHIDGLQSKCPRPQFLKRR
jgi:uncharacterized LabA/DUF88 family protein